MQSEAFASGKEYKMRLNMHAVIWKVIDFLRRPFLQRLVTLVAAMLLAMSLVSAALVTAFSRSGNEVALISAHRQAQKAFEGTMDRYAFIVGIMTSGLVVDQPKLSLQEDHQMQRRQR
jgi:hypothetical protein